MESVSKIMKNAMEKISEVTQVPYPRRATLFNHPISQERSKFFTLGCSDSSFFVYPLMNSSRRDWKRFKTSLTSFSSLFLARFVTRSW